jgi:DNA-binding transcriptional regulator YdaS (Cro superfamily)
MKNALMPAPTLLRKCLMALEQREKVLTAQIQAVCQGYTTGCFVHGPGGLGKSHLIVTILEGLKGKSWRHHTAYTTPKALMMAIAEYPESIHLFEDCEKMYKTDVAASILRAACGSPKQRSRTVTYETANEKYSVQFTGGIIIVSNEDLAKGKGALQAVASRFKPVKWDMTVQERIARILQIAGLGWSKGERYVDPKECHKVAEFLIKEMLTGELSAPVDIRTFVEHAMPAYLQHKEGRTTVDWKEIVKSKLCGQVNNNEKRTDRNDRLRQLALAIASDTKLDRKAKVAKWTEETGMGQAIYYRHLKAAKYGI